jgi:hypothetical protein
MQDQPEAPVILSPEDNSPVVAPESEPSKLHWQRFRHFKTWYGGHKKWSIPATIILVVAVLAAVPWTRYHIAGLFLKKNFTIEISDATAQTPVSGAMVSADGISATTNGAGQATLDGIKVGPQSVSISKKYYQNKTVELTVPILSQKTKPDVNLTATGRQVKISVTNLITKKPLADVDIEIADTNAKTDSSGDALLVLPANASSQKATLSLSGYNNANATVQVSDISVKQNNFQLTPAGEVYFLSNGSGSLDVMKANLDGSDTQVAVAGTGNEEADNTSLLESADGKYVGLVAKRDASDPTPQLYVLSTTDDKLFPVDSGDATFQMYDWAGDTLVYTDQRQDLPVWQQGVGKIKAYDAATGSTTLLDQTAGSDSATDANEYYNEVMVTADSVIYGKVWQGSGDFTSKQNSLQTINVDGQDHQTLATYNVANNLSFSQHSPDTLYIWQHDNSTNTDTYSQYTADSGGVKTINITNDQFYQDQNAYYFSPSRQQTFWSESADGKQNLIIGDQSGDNLTTIASLSDYSAYGWLGEQYLLVSKDSSELDVISVKGGTPIKIGNYLASSFNYQ